MYAREKYERGDFVHDSVAVWFVIHLCGYLEDA
jgi:hypothetical protein